MGDIKSASLLDAVAWRGGQSSTVSLIHSGREESKNKPSICFHWFSRLHWLSRQPTQSVIFSFFLFSSFPLLEIKESWNFSVSNEDTEDTWTNHSIILKFFAENVSFYFEIPLLHCFSHIRLRVICKHKIFVWLWVFTKRNFTYFLLLLVTEQRLCFKNAGWFAELWLYEIAPSLAQNAASRSIEQLNWWEIWDTLWSQEMQSYIDCKTPCQMK